MTPSTVLCVVGTRPEAIKMAPIVQALRRYNGVQVRLLLTGQHRDLLDQALAAFGLRGDIDLDLMRPNQTLSGLAARILDGLDPLLAEAPPAMVLAQGDTTTVMAAAIACFHRRIPFGHVEAGLRTGDLQHPFPEEFNRIVAGRAATLNFAPTEGARLALLREGVPEARVHVTGNTVIDALLDVARRAPPMPAGLPPHGRLVLMTLHRRESFGEPVRQVLSAVQRLCAAFPDLHVLYPVHPNPNVREAAHAMLGANPQVTLTGPLGYAELVAAMRHCTLVLTDSGGLQEEAPALGKPVLVLREVTERPEAVDLGVARLVGTDPARILAEASALLTSPIAYAAMAKGVSPYGDGRAAERIAAIVAQAVGIQPALLEPAA
ncbi:non-hydrolyzing UDP-N-acetylglucosamine 2-epimerase [Paracraurococcus lichenis]|uniref:UDP-N-acetylglucosamine 2-epimerase (non-hydrolyzing) n=1 Tax=Paracraurococcus lichenis TaxID=3064888 RepID=A0ABT9E487_9PROT|nr:UDP-N-acetylglucosamine 2-epimerase (non-hydrolyzing) [Paracraurococcus sp. LOR1-02]MDO9710973.1 UDP-N-acetylglucosamine 2-epimerase (non-hydrolyzing) [Paracraurococcus sp. LOR1-02]